MDNADVQPGPITEVFKDVMNLSLKGMKCLFVLKKVSNILRYFFYYGIQFTMQWHN